MSPDDHRADHEFDDFGPACSLQELQRRSQTDFEIEFFGRILERDPGYHEVLVILRELFVCKGWHRRALQLDEQLARLSPHDPTVQYKLACSLALLRRVPEAIAALRRAIDAGYCDFSSIMADADLDRVRDTPLFQALLVELATGTRWV